VTSVDGLTWEDRTVVSAADLYAVAWGKDVYIAAGASSLILTSPDGSSWTQRAARHPDLTPAAVAFAGNAFILAANDDATLGAVYYFRSVDGISWQETYVWRLSSWVHGMVWTGLQLVSFGDNGSIQTSPDGMQWTDRTSVATGDQETNDVMLTAVADTPNGLVAVGELGCVRTSRDGMVWQQCATDASGWIWDVATTPSGVLAVGEFGLMLTSPDLVTWHVLEPVTSETLTGVAAGGGHLVIVGDNGTVVTSEDGRNWAVGETGLPIDMGALAYGSGLFVGVGQNGTVATSPDGRVWKQVTTGVTVDLNGVMYQDSRFVAVGSGGTILTSSNGMTWMPQKAGTTASLFSVTSQNGVLVAVGDKGTVVTSTDAIRWSVSTTPTKEILYGCAARGSTFVAVGSSDTTMWTSDLVAPASPAPIRPLVGATVDMGSVTLTWSTVPGAVTYDVQTATTADFSKVTIEKHGVSWTSVTLSAAEVADTGMTYWRVRAVGAALVSAWSAVQSFTVRVVPPPQPRQIILVLHVASTQMSVNGMPVTIDVAPQIVEGRTLLPIKWVAEPLGADVSWNATDRKVTISLNGTILELWVGKSQARVNGAPVAIDTTNAKVVPVIVSGRTMLPVRFVAEQLGADVQWEQSTKTITITYQQP